MDPGEILSPEPIESIEGLTLDPLCEPLVVDAWQAMSRLDEQSGQRGVVDLRHDMVVEQRLAFSVEYFVGHDPAKKTTHETLRSEDPDISIPREV